MAEFDWRHPDFSIQLLNGELPSSKPASSRRGSSSRSSSRSRSKAPSKRRSRPSVKNPGGNYNGKYGEGVYKRSAQINPDYYVDDLEEFLDNNGTVEGVKHNLKQRIDNHKTESEYLEGRLNLIGNAYNDRNHYTSGTSVSFKDAQEDARSLGLPGFRYNNRHYDTKFNEGDNIIDMMGYTIMPASNLKTSAQSQPQQRMNYDGMSFGKAFAAAKKSGASTFNWRGKDYTTEVAGAVPRRHTRRASVVATPAEPTTPFVDNSVEPMDRVVPEIAPYVDVNGNIMNNPYATHAYPSTQYGWGGWLMPICPK